MSKVINWSRINSSKLFFLSCLVLVFLVLLVVQVHIGYVHVYMLFHTQDHSKHGFNADISF